MFRSFFFSSRAKSEYLCLFSFSLIYYANIYGRWPVIISPCFSYAYKIKQEFFQAETASVLLYGFTTWALTIRLEKNLDGFNTQNATSYFEQI